MSFSAGPKLTLSGPRPWYLSAPVNRHSYVFCLAFICAASPIRASECQTLLSLIDQNALRVQAIHVDHPEVSLWNRFVHIETLLSIEEKLHQNHGLSPHEQLVLKSFKSRSMDQFEGENLGTQAVILEYLAMLSRSSAENLSIGAKLLDRYLEAAQAEHGRLSNFYFDQLIRLLSSKLTTDSSALRFQLKLIQRKIYYYKSEFPELKILWAQMNPRLVAPHIVPTKHKGTPVGNTYTEYTPYILDPKYSTPIAYKDSDLSRFNPKKVHEGFGSKGFWLRPGSIVRLVQIYPAPPPYKSTSPEALGEVSLIFAVEFKSSDVFYDRALTKPFDPKDHEHNLKLFENYKTPTILNPLLRGYVSLAVFNTLMPSKFKNGGD
jgi:hypothetical protein